jgi:hypothetical protein
MDVKNYIEKVCRNYGFLKDSLKVHGFTKGNEMGFEKDFYM